MADITVVKTSQGPKGPRGDIQWRGTWDSSTDYAKGESVFHSNESWIAASDPAVGDEPGVASAWDKLAAAGDVQSDETNMSVGDHTRVKSLSPTVLEPAMVAPATTFTVGSGGDFSMLNDALADLLTKAPRYVAGGGPVIVTLLSGFVLSEQILLGPGIDLSWIEIRSDDATVTIDRSALTTDYQGAFPAFGARQGARLPSIQAAFDMDTSGTSTDRDGVFLWQGAFAVVKNGITNCGGKGLNVRESSWCHARNTDWSGAGKDGGGNSHCISVSGGTSFANVRGATASDGGAGGLRASEGSHVNAFNIVAKNAPDVGVRASNGSVVNAQGANVDGSTSTISGHGLVAGEGCSLNAEGAVATNCAAAGVLATHASMIHFGNGDASGSTYGIKVLEGGLLNAAGATGTLSKTANSVGADGIIFQ